MKQFSSIQKIDTGILYALEFASSISVLLLAFGLIASMANVLTKGSVLSDSPFMQEVWAWTQCIAIDASVAGAILRTFRYYQEGERLKCRLYAVLSALLLFTAAIVSNIESVQQTLNLTLESAYAHMFVPVELLIWVRSVAIVLLIVAHAMRHATTGKSTQPVRSEHQVVTLTPEIIEVVRSPIERTALPEPDNYERVKAYLAEHPNATVREVATALSISPSTANKWMRRAKEEAAQ
jgi:hypothetical protein